MNVNNVSDNPVLGVIRLDTARDLALPAYETAGAAGLDLRAAISADEPLNLVPSRWLAIPTGLVFEVPTGFEAQIRPRSGLALEYGISILNAPGTIDSDYRGEIKVMLINHGQESFLIHRGMRIAQAVIVPVARVIIEVKSLISQTQRGTGGFGSTGI